MGFQVITCWTQFQLRHQPPRNIQITVSSIPHLSYTSITRQLDDTLPHTYTLGINKSGTKQELAATLRRLRYRTSKKEKSPTDISSRVQRKKLACAPHERDNPDFLSGSLGAAQGRNHLRALGQKRDNCFAPSLLSRAKCPPAEPSRSPRRNTKRGQE